MGALVAVVLVASLAVGCGASPSPSPSGSASATLPVSATPAASATPATPGPSVDPITVLTAIEAQVQRIRGLRATSPVTPRFVSPAEMRSIVTNQAMAESPPALIAAYEGLYRAMGLLAPGASLSALYSSLLESQVAGLYVPATKNLYVVSKGGQVGGVEKLFFSHEYDHALQDQAFNLTKFMGGLADDTDAQLARQSLVEGDAYTLMGQWLQANGSPSDILQVLAASTDTSALETLQSIPRIIQTQVLFAAIQGQSFVSRMQAAGGWAAVDDAFRNHPPLSTSQILHPELWAAGEKPIAVTLPADLAGRIGGGWKTALSDTFGEYQTSIWLEDAGSVDTATATAAAAGWAGDRLTYLTGPGGAWAFAWRSTWQTAADAAQFVAAASTTSLALAGRPQHEVGRVEPGAGATDAWVILASDGPTLARLRAALGLAR